MRHFQARAFVLFLLAACLFAFPAALYAQGGDYDFFPGDIFEERAGRGLMLRSSPAGARVFIDGIERGNTPLHLAALMPGRYLARVEKDGYVTRRFALTLREGSRTDISVELKEAVGRLLLNIRRKPGSGQLPFNPEVSVDGQAYPQFDSKQPALELRAGFRTVQVRAFGWEDNSATIYVEEDSFGALDFDLEPAAFRLGGALLSRARFNPENSGSLGTTAFKFEVSAPGNGSLSVFDQAGNTVFTRELPPFETRLQSAVWDGRNASGEIQNDGMYTLVIKAAPLPAPASAPLPQTISLAAELDSSGLIYPLTLSSGKGGLLFTPLPVSLPLHSFQIEGSLLAGNPPLSNGPWESLPFSAGARFTPLEHLEVSAALNVIPAPEKDTGAAFAGSAKWVFPSPEGRARPGLPAFNAAAGITAAWTGGSGPTPFGMAPGIELFFPLGLNAGKHFSLTLTPAALWTGDADSPWSGIPRLLVSGGLLARGRYIGAGLSARTEYNFEGSGGKARPPSLMAGGEIKIFPPPSSFVISLLGGIWKRNNTTGIFGGLGIGMIQ